MLSSQFSTNFLELSLSYLAFSLLMTVLISLTLGGFLTCFVVSCCLVKFRLFDDVKLMCDGFLGGNWGEPISGMNLFSSGSIKVFNL